MSADEGYSHNDIYLRYYREPQFKNINTQFAYANENKPVFIGAEFFWGDDNVYLEFLKFSDLKCRFTSSSDSSKVIVTQAIMETAPIGQFDKEALPN